MHLTLYLFYLSRNTTLQSTLYKHAYIYIYIYVALSELKLLALALLILTNI